jgi:peptidoglycan hydrolase CwlO-like protein
MMDTPHQTPTERIQILKQLQIEIDTLLKKIADTAEKIDQVKADLAKLNGPPHG